MTKINGGDQLTSPIGFRGLFTGTSAVDRQMAFSIAIGLLNVIKNAKETRDSISWISNTISISPGEPGGLEPPQYREQIKSKVFHLRMAMVIYMAVITYTIAKLLAVFMCNFSMFNVTGCAKSPGSC